DPDAAREEGFARLLAESGDVSKRRLEDRMEHLGLVRELAIARRRVAKEEVRRARPYASVALLEEARHARVRRARDAGNRQALPALAPGVDARDAASAEPEPKRPARVEDAAVELDRSDAELLHADPPRRRVRIGVDIEHVEASAFARDHVAPPRIANDAIGRRVERRRVERDPIAPLEPRQAKAARALAIDSKDAPERAR